MSIFAHKEKVSSFTFITVLSRSDAMSGMFASNMSENKFANIFACLKISN